MFKPLDDDYASPSEEISNFTNRENEQEVLRRVLNLPEGATLPVLMFYGVGGTGKTWLLQKLRQCLGQDIPSAYLDLDPRSGGTGYYSDTSRALAEIRRQFGTLTCIRFDLAYAWIRYKESAGDEPLFGSAGLLRGAWELLGEVAGSVIPGGNLATWLAKKLSPPFWHRFNRTKLAEWISTRVGEKDFLWLKQADTQKIYPQLAHRLLKDLNDNLPTQSSKQCRGVLFIDTFEAVRLGLSADAQVHEQESRMRQLYHPDSPVLLVIAGRDYLRWAEVEPAFDERAHLEQHLLGGLSEWDAREFLKKCGVLDAPVQDAVLQVARDVETQRTDGALGYHPFSLGLCVDTILASEGRGETVDPADFDMAPGDTRQLAQRFMKSLGEPAHAAWVQRLSLTPWFDEMAARAAFSPSAGAAQDAAWQMLLRYSFVKPTDVSGWYTLHSKMREALEHVQGEETPNLTATTQGDDSSSFVRGHNYWRKHWLSRSQTDTDQFAALAWYHQWRVEPETAQLEWQALAEALRAALRMSDHYMLLSWWETTSLQQKCIAGDRLAAASLNSLGMEYWQASVGSHRENLKRAVECYNAALQVFVEARFPRDFAATQGNLANAYLALESDNRVEDFQRAVDCYRAALRVYTEEEMPDEWAAVQNNLGNAYRLFPAGNRSENLESAIECYRASLRVRTEEDSPQTWAMTQNNLGKAYMQLPSGNGGENTEQAIQCYLAALRVYTEEHLPQAWAGVQTDLAIDYLELSTGTRAKNLNRAIEYCRAAFRVFTYDNFPREWAMTSGIIGVAYQELANVASDASFLALARDAYANAERGYRKCGLDASAADARLALDTLCTDSAFHSVTYICSAVQHPFPNPPHEE